MLERRAKSEGVCAKENIRVFGGQDIKYLNSVEKCSCSTKTSNKVAHMYNERRGFCVFTFIDKVFVFSIKQATRTDSCLQIDTNDNSWKEVTRMNNESRISLCST